MAYRDNPGTALVITFGVRFRFLKRRRSSYNPGIGPLGKNNEEYTNKGREASEAVPGLYYIRPIIIHPTIMYHQPFRKRSFFWDHLPGKTAFLFGGGGGGGGKCAIYVKFDGAVPGL